jgi:SAM-dependent methyltransferase
MLMLNLGCGRRTHPDFVSIDYSRLAALKGTRVGKLLISWQILTPLPSGYLNYDLHKGIPFGNETVDVVYSSHLLEHLPHASAWAFLKEIYRVLKPAGWVRIVVPDLEGIVRFYLAALEECRSGLDGAEKRYDWAVLWLLDQMVRTEPGGEMARWLRGQARATPMQTDSLDPWQQGILREIVQEGASSYRGLKWGLGWLFPSDPGLTGELHRWMYDDFSLARLLGQVGFQDVQRRSHLQSGIPNWAQYCLDSNPDGTPHQPGSIWMEARKLESVA